MARERYHRALTLQPRPSPRQVGLALKTAGGRFDRRADYVEAEEPAPELRSICQLQQNRNRAIYRNDREGVSVLLVRWHSRTF